MGSSKQLEAILVTGGAGYIGSHVALAILDAGGRVVVLDDLSTGRRGAIPDGALFVEANAGDVDAVGEVLRANRIRSVVHLAGSTSVEESVSKPLDYYENNVEVSRRLIDTCIRVGVEQFVFSSSAAVYGEPERIPVSEKADPKPISPYGRTKLIVEWMLADATRDGLMRFACLRYFNVAGADPALRAGPSAYGAEHLLKNICAAILGTKDKVSIYGDDYPTDDGTCIRDFIHVSDLADIHVMALSHLIENNKNITLNCGYGTGRSIRQIVDAAQKVCGGGFAVETAARRSGDICAMVADTSTLSSLFGWKPRHDDLAAMIQSMLEWEKKTERVD